MGSDSPVLKFLKLKGPRPLSSTRPLPSLDSLLSSPSKGMAPISEKEACRWPDADVVLHLLRDLFFSEMRLWRRSSSLHSVESLFLPTLPTESQCFNCFKI